MIQVAIEKYKQVQDKNWNETEKFSGKRIKIKGSPRDKKVKILLCLPTSAEYIVTNGKDSGTMEKPISLDG